LATGGLVATRHSVRLHFPASPALARLWAKLPSPRGRPGFLRTAESANPDIPVLKKAKIEYAKLSARAR